MHATRRAFAIALLLAAAQAGAQNYPSRPVTLIVPYPAGGPTDQLARQIAPRFSAKFGQNFIVENVSGGGTNIAGQRVARAAPDGHTLLIHNLQFSANVALYPTLPFDTEKDFIPVALLNNNPLVLTGRKSIPANSLAELATWMKSNTAKMAHPGTGSTGHLSTFLVAQAMGVKVVNPGGILAFKFNQRKLDLDETNAHYGLTPRQVLLALAQQRPAHIGLANGGLKNDQGGDAHGTERDYGRHQLPRQARQKQHVQA